MIESRRWPRTQSPRDERQRPAPSGPRATSRRASARASHRRLRAGRRNAPTSPHTSAFLSGRRRSSRACIAARVVRRAARPNPTSNARGSASRSRRRRGWYDDSVRRGVPSCSTVKPERSRSGGLSARPRRIWLRSSTVASTLGASWKRIRNGGSRTRRRVRSTTPRSPVCGRSGRCARPDAALLDEAFVPAAEDVRVRERSPARPCWRARRDGRATPGSRRFSRLSPAASSARGPSGSGCGPGPTCRRRPRDRRSSGRRVRPLEAEEVVVVVAEALGADAAVRDQQVCVSVRTDARPRSADQVA